ncbi:hypothetical protein GN958_ATG13379 [Phytophthora infestans]|uniref:Uncharacterized protein n=1 Tax=Phytophthora infestans TaxID=4787 RepID=A0A8S9UAF7_PHYIN|nr:hypothetical protein GN958_ATG13379 [Phytophthora infestans]
MPRPPANKKQSKTAAKKVLRNKKAAKFTHTTPSQVEGMVLWIEVGSNRAIYVGESTAGKGMAQNSGITKLAGFASMAQYVHEYAMQYGGADPRHTVFKRYKNARERKNSNTGFGITEEMLANGITVDHIIEKACPFYKRMDAIDNDVRLLDKLTDDRANSGGAYAACDSEDHELGYPDFRLDKSPPDSESDGGETVFSVGAEDLVDVRHNHEDQANPSKDFQHDEGEPDQKNRPPSGMSHAATDATSISNRLPLQQLLGLRNQSSLALTPPQYQNDQEDFTSRRRFQPEARTSTRATQPVAKSVSAAKAVAKQKEWRRQTQAEKTRHVGEKSAKLKLEAESKQFKKAIEFQNKELDAHVSEQRRSREERDQERQDKRREKRDEERRKMAVEVLLGGKPISEVQALVEMFLPSY